MIKKTRVIILVFVLLAAMLSTLLYEKRQVEAPTSVSEIPAKSEIVAVPSDYKNAAYTIEGEPVTLVNGYAETRIMPDSEAKKITRYFGNELKTDLDGDGNEDVAFVVTQETGGSGTFFYAVAALKTDEGYVGSDGYFLGDRIAPQTTTLSQNPVQKYIVVFNYAEHGPNQGLSEQPSVGKSVYLKIVPETKEWAIVEPNFEGESAR